jgi:hypothetical protein
MENQIIAKQYVHQKDQDNILFSVDQKNGELTIKSKKQNITISNNNALYLISEIQNDLLDFGNIQKGRSRFNFWNFLLQKL